MKKQKIMIGLYTNTTRVSVEKISSEVRDFFDNSFIIQKINEAITNKKPFEIPYDFYDLICHKLTLHERREDKKEQGALLLFIDHNFSVPMIQRKKIWYGTCECGTDTNTRPFKDHQDVLECSFCGNMKIQKLMEPQFYI